MKRVFTDYLHALKGPQPPAPTLCEQLLEALRKALRSALRRRGLWNNSPRYLGILGESWRDPEAFEELLLATYEEIFVRRLESLARQLQAAETIDGTVIVAIDHFLHDRQKDQDPLGRRVFQVAHRAVEKLVLAGRLRVLSGSALLRNNTVVAFPAGEAGQVPASSEDLRREVGALDGILPGLVGTWHLEPVAEALAEQLGDFEQEGVAVFRLGDLFTALKQGARAFLVDELTSVGEFLPEYADEDGCSRLVGTVDPAVGWEEAQSFKHLTRCVVEGIHQGAVRPAMRRDLYRYWKLMCFWAAEVPVQVPATGGSVDLGEKEPSGVRVGKLLGIGRGRVPRLRKVLGELLVACGARYASSRGTT